MFIGVPSGGTETSTIAELAIFRELQKENFGKVVYLTPHEG
jgi:replicative superfamily II helicase